MSIYTKIGKKAGGFLLGVGSSNFSRKAVKKVGGRKSTINLGGNLLKSLPKKVGGGKVWNIKTAKNIAKGTSKAKKNVKGLTSVFKKSTNKAKSRVNKIGSNFVKQTSANALMLGGTAGFLGLGGVSLLDHTLDVLSTTDEQREAEKDTQIMQDRKDLFDSFDDSGSDYSGIGDSMGLGGLPSVGGSSEEEGSSLMNIGLIAGAVGGSYLIYKKMKKSKKSKK